MTEREHDPIEPQELEEENGELLPDREAMSIITPGFDMPNPVEDLPPA